VLLVDAQRARVGAQEAAHEHVGRKARVIVVLELVQDANRDARGLRQLSHRHVSLLSFPLQVASE